MISKANFEGYESQYSKAEAAVATGSQLDPPEDMTDGSKCGDDEEDFAMACYKKCSILTNGVAPVRTSPWSCCASAHCKLSEERINVKLCAGYDVAGDKEGKDKCPHKEGLCYENEELHLGLCYKKCSILTNGAYIHRKSAITCCNNPNLLQCIPFLNPKNTDTATGYSIGGGKGDGDKTTIATPHAPIEALAEVVAQVLTHRRKNALTHPINRMVRERWVRSELMADPSQIGMATLEIVEIGRAHV